MAKHNDRHLTTEQLSAFLDQQLPPTEQALCDAHLQTCQQCQTALASLRQTVALLQALPQPTLPRSFALPTDVTYLQERPAQQDAVAQSRPLTASQPEPRKLWLSYIQRTTRAASAIAAVIGLIFLLSTVLPTFPHAGGASPSAANPAANPSTTSANSSATATGKLSPSQQGASPTADQTKQPAKATATPVFANRIHNGQQSQGQSSLPLPDVNTVLGRQELGFLLLALGIIGIMLTTLNVRRRPKRT